jgi:hypothetical protein
MKNILDVLAHGGPIDGFKSYIQSLLMIAVGIAGAIWPQVGEATGAYGLPPGALIVGGLGLGYLRQAIAKIGERIK